MPISETQNFFYGRGKTIKFKSLVPSGKLTKSNGTHHGDSDIRFVSALLRFDIRNVFFRMSKYGF